MQKHLWAGITPFFFVITALGQNGKPRTGEEPPPPLRGEIHIFVDAAPLRSFKELCEKSDAIIEGVAETAAARMMPGGGAKVETDVWIDVTRVLKGTAETRKLVVAEDGGTFGELRVIANYPLMQRNERYVLFLWKDTRPGIPFVDDLPRYRIYNIPFGKYPIEHGKIHLANGGFPRYDGMSIEAFLTEIATQLKR